MSIFFFTKTHTKEKEKGKGMNDEISRLCGIYQLTTSHLGLKERPFSRLRSNWIFALTLLLEL